MTTPTDDADGVPPPFRSGLGRHTSVMASGTAVSRVLGFVKGAMLVSAVSLTGNAANALAVPPVIPIA